MNVNYAVLLGAANFTYVNGYVEEAASYYSKAAEYAEDLKAKLYGGIAYYKAGKMKNRKEYFEKAVSLLKEALKEGEIEDEAKYYLSLTYSEMGKLEEANKMFEEVKKTRLLEERAVISTIKSIIYVKAREAEELREAYSVLDDPLLVEMFNIIRPYIRGTDIEERLGKKWGKSGAVGFALELKEAYATELKKPGNPFAKIARTAIRALKGENPKYEKLFEGDVWSERELEGLPVLTRKVVMELMSKFGRREGESVRVPALITKELEKIKEIARAYHEIGKANKEELKQLLKAVGGEGKLKEYVEKLEKGLPIDKRVLRKRLWEALMGRVKVLLKKVKLFFYEGKERQILKLLLSELPLSNEEKVEIFLEI